MAEVLITLTIIGVVAALTIPSLIQHYKKQEASARLKKFYSMMSQAIILSELDNGPVNDWDIQYRPLSYDDGTSVAERVEANRELSLNTFNKYIKPYIKYISIDENANSHFLSGEIDKQYKSIKVSLTDGSVLYFRNGDCSDMVFDINGTKGPDKFGQDMYSFIICNSDGKKNFYIGNSKVSFGPICPGEGCDTREKAFEKCKDNADYCAKLLLFDSWEFKPDYPHKF